MRMPACISASGTDLDQFLVLIVHVHLHKKNWSEKANHQVHDVFAPCTFAISSFCLAITTTRFTNMHHSGHLFTILIGFHGTSVDLPLHGLRSIAFFRLATAFCIVLLLLSNIYRCAGSALCCGRTKPVRSINTEASNSTWISICTIHFTIANCRSRAKRENQNKPKQNLTIISIWVSMAVMGVRKGEDRSRCLPLLCWDNPEMSSIMMTCSCFQKELRMPWFWAKVSLFFNCIAPIKILQPPLMAKLIDLNRCLTKRNQIALPTVETHRSAVVRRDRQYDKQYSKQLQKFT